MTTAREVNFDALVGPTHHYAGLAVGNLAAMQHQGAVSNPRAAALEGLEKMRVVMELGVPQAVLPPHERPDMGALRRLGFSGSDALVLERAGREAPDILAVCSSASAMWAANAATVSPSADTDDGHVHFTPANLIANLHRSLEAATTERVLRALFSDPAHFTIHPPLPSAQPLADEGAANHLRLAATHGAPGLEVFVYGEDAAAEQATCRFAPRQKLGASAAVARLHCLDPARVLFVRQHPSAIDQGVFHNDVIAVANENVLLYHAAAWEDSPAVVAELRRRLEWECHSHLVALPVSEDELTIPEAVESYLFNSQLLTLETAQAKRIVLLAPSDCRDHPRARAVIEWLLQTAAIHDARYVSIRQSMHNGGGPACLRLRVVLTPAEYAAVHPGILLTEALCQRLRIWINHHYRARLTLADLADPALLRESRAALDELTAILGLPGLYSFQQ